MLALHFWWIERQEDAKLNPQWTVGKNSSQSANNDNKRMIVYPRASKFKEEHCSIHIGLPSVSQMFSDSPYENINSTGLMVAQLINHLDMQTIHESQNDKAEQTARNKIAYLF